MCGCVVTVVVVVKVRVVIVVAHHRLMVRVDDWAWNHLVVGER